MRQLYLAATGMNRGKTTVALGLMAALQERGHDIGFTKPVGQRYAIVDGEPADEDAILMQAALGINDPLSDMSPVHIPRGFTKAYIKGEVTSDLPGRIRQAHATLADKHDLLLVEGTGHAGVGSVVGLSNATVARMLKAPAAIVAEAGVGRPIDEIVLNRALFARHGVEVVGAIVNKVDADAHPTLPDILRDGLAKHGIDLLGMLPYRPLLSNPTLSMLVEQVKGEVLSQSEDLDRVIEHVAIGAMQPKHLLERVGPGSLLIIPGDRTDVIHAMVAANRASRERSAERRRLFARRQQLFGRVPQDVEPDRAGRPHPHRRLPAAAARPRRDPAGAALCIPGRAGHVRGRVRRSRPAGQDAPGRPREDRAHPSAGQRTPRYRPRPRPLHRSRGFPCRAGPARGGGNRHRVGRSARQDGRFWAALAWSAVGFDA